VQDWSSGWIISCLISLKHIPYGSHRRFSLIKRREEKPTRCHSVLYCTYDMLNMFWALLCPSSGAPDDGHRSAQNMLSIS